MQGSEHNIQFFMLVQLPIDPSIQASQFVPQQISLASRITSKRWACPRCGKSISGGWKYCPECGCRLSCDSCGNRIGESDKYCSNCGHNLSSK